MNPHRIASAFFVGLCACFVPPLSAGETGARYTYKNLALPDGLCRGVIEAGTEGQYEGGDKHIIDTSPVAGKPSARGKYKACHSITSLLPCEDALYHCFRTRAKHFAVPKLRGLQVGQRWTTMDSTFEVIRTEVVGYLGKHHETFVIATGNKRGGTSYFYWSEEAGLLAMRDVAQLDGRESVDAYVVESARGFPY